MTEKINGEIALDCVSSKRSYKLFSFLTRARESRALLLLDLYP